MAEQVVDIRQRIERMRTQIDDVAEPKKIHSTDKVKISNDDQVNLQKNKEVIKQKDVKENTINSEKSDLRKMEEPTKKIRFPNENKHESNKDKETEFTQSYFKKIEKFENKQKKSFSDYQLKNTTDENDKKVNFDKNEQSFPQFSLNINNPISWKLMLLIMLMQLLTNIMLVVVLYFK